MSGIKLTGSICYVYLFDVYVCACVYLVQVHTAVLSFTQ